MIVRNRFELSDNYLREFVTNPTPEMFLCGLELEIEDVHDMHHMWLEEHQIMVETDGSLRNHGHEFLIGPGTLEENIKLFADIHSGEISYGKDAFSSRTSTHVHVNMMYSDLYQVKNLLLLYSIFEDLFFNFVGPERKNNIHCVPLGYTHMSRNYGASTDILRSRWHKYTAFNLLPLNEKGTVEFRHLEGTNDKERVCEWLKLIRLLWNTAHSKSSLNVNDLLSIEWLKELTTQILTPAFLRQCKETPTFQVEKNLLDVKLAFL